MLERGCGLLLLLLVFYVFGAGAGKGGAPQQCEPNF